MFRHYFAIVIISPLAKLLKKPGQSAGFFISAPRNGRNRDAQHARKDPGLWAALVPGCLPINPNSMPPACLFLIAALRVVYGGGTRRQMMLEGALCGLITLALVPLLEWMGLPQGMATFAGGMVGFMGVEKLRGYSDMFMSRKAQG